MDSKRWLIGCLTALSLVFSPVVRSADTVSPATAGQVAVTGTGSVTIPPTTASFSITVGTSGPTAAVVSEENARTSKAVMEALARSDLKPGDIKRSHLSIGPRWDDDDGRPPRRSAYEATNTVRIETDNLSSLGSIIDLALTAGASEVSEVTYTSREIDAARAAALTQAVQAARREADVIARANGGTLGALVLMDTQPQPQDYAFQEVVVTGTRKRDARVAPALLAPEEITVTSSIEGRWLFVPGAAR